MGAVVFEFLDLCFSIVLDDAIDNMFNGCGAIINYHYYLSSYHNFWLSDL
jgi:hypothetical protein